MKKQLTSELCTTLLIVLDNDTDNEATVILAVEGRRKEHRAKALHKSSDFRCGLHRRFLYLRCLTIR
jgi:hypothetical protein